MNEHKLTFENEDIKYMWSASIQKQKLRREPGKKNKKLNKKVCIQLANNNKCSKNYFI